MKDFNALLAYGKRELNHLHPGLGDIFCLEYENLPADERRHRKAFIDQWPTRQNIRIRYVALCLDIPRIDPGEVIFWNNLHEIIRRAQCSDWYEKVQHLLKGYPHIEARINCLTTPLSEAEEILL